jgi:hypothetical protein
MKTIDRVENRRKSGLAQLFDFNTDSILVDEKIVINALIHLGRKYFGAIDSEDQDEMFKAYGINFEPSRNNGDRMWLLTKYC